MTSRASSRSRRAASKLPVAQNRARARHSHSTCVPATVQRYSPPFYSRRVKKAFNVALATALVDFYPPKHHPRALGIINAILAKDPDNVPCLMGRGYVLEYVGKWQEAEELFAKVARLLPDDLDRGLRAREESAWCKANSGGLEKAAAELKEVIATLDGLEERETDKARCWYRLGRCYWDMGGKALAQCHRTRQHANAPLKPTAVRRPTDTS